MKKRKYVYFVSYCGYSENGSILFGRSKLKSKIKLKEFISIHDIETTICDNNGFKSVVILNWKRLKK